MAVVNLPDLLQSDEKLGTIDDTETLQKVLNRAPWGSVIRWPALYNVEGTLRFYDRKQSWLGPGGIQVKTDYGEGTPSQVDGYTARRDRATINLYRTDFEICDKFMYRGPHPFGTGKGPRVHKDDNPNKSLVPAYEGQAFLRLHSTVRTLICDPDWGDPWGDFIWWGHDNPSKKVPPRNTVILGGHMVSCGRSIAVPKYFEDITWKGTKIGLAASGALINHEPLTSDPLVINRGLWIEGLDVDQTSGIFLRLQGTAGLEDMVAINCTRTGDPISVHANGATPDKCKSMGAEYPRFRHFRITGHVWDDAQEGGQFARFDHIHDIVYGKNAGPIRFTTPKPTFNSCSNVIQYPNDFTVTR